MGYLPPVVHIRDNLELAPARYRILMKGVEIGSGEAQPGRWLAINPGNAIGELAGDKTIDPAFGLEAVWIDSALREQAQIQGYTVVEASTVVATHLNHSSASSPANCLAARRRSNCSIACRRRCRS